MKNIGIEKKINKKLIIALIGLIVVGTIVAYMYWVRTPQYSLNQIKKAVQQHDLITFEKYVDIDSLVTRFIDQAIAKEMHNSTDGTAKLAAGLVEMIKPKIVESSKNQIKAYIEKGDFEETKENDTGISVKHFYKGVEFRSIDKIKKSGNIDLVALKIYNKRFEEELILEVKMRKLDSYWQVVELNNIGSLMDKIEELENEKLAELNKPIIEEMKNAVSYENIEIRKIEGDDWGFSKEVHFPVTIKCLTDKNIAGLGATIIVKNKQGKVILEMPVRSTRSTYKDKVSVVKWDKEINPFIEEDEILYNTSASELDVSIYTDYLVYEDGTEVKLLKELP
ncbi:DUF2939 domain-containing protein [Anaeromicrobium sediminis]|uniref:DUF2939 domain-containing protein n=1 Tax=Anaeromicrobium sediminis TaxID=1478221 RepID=A0A267MQK5_9FIRM|nr:DUF2939 domain-containing protein [Anaeromicrobium sediminis]PAB61010.1 hypothetical protein CCE28_00840 [Anaeromicrobium sediminis]